MKKVLLMSIIALISSVSVIAQEGSFKAGIHVGIPTGDIEKVSSFNAGLDLTYLFSINDDFKVGGTIGYTNFFGKTITSSFAGSSVSISTDDVSFIPLAASIEYGLSPKFYLGADLGYAISTDDDIDGGLYYQPKIGYNATDVIDIFFAYKGIAIDDLSVGVISLGAAYKF